MEIRDPSRTLQRATVVDLSKMVHLMVTLTRKLDRREQTVVITYTDYNARDTLHSSDRESIEESASAGPVLPTDLSDGSHSEIKDTQQDQEGHEAPTFRDEDFIATDSENEGGNASFVTKSQDGDFTEDIVAVKQNKISPEVFVAVTEWRHPHLYQPRSGHNWMDDDEWSPTDQYSISTAKYQLYSLTVPTLYGKCTL